jgi:hypothetical protein
VSKKQATKKVNKLDYKLVPEPDSTPTFTDLPPDLMAAMRKLPRTLGRMEAALRSVYEMDNFKSGDAGAQSRAEGQFRNALVEYVAIEDTLNHELSPLQPKFKLFDTENPLPHILRLLRHAQTHRTANEMSSITISLWLKLVPGAQPVDKVVWVIKDLTDAQFRNLDSFKWGPLHTSPGEGNG